MDRIAPTWPLPVCRSQAGPWFSEGFQETGVPEERGGAPLDGEPEWV